MPEGEEMTRPDLLKWGPLSVSMGEKPKASPVFVKRLFSDERLTVGPTDGAPIVSATDVFGSINHNFVDWGINDHGPLTEETPLAISKIVADGKLSEVLSAFGGDQERRYWWPSQVKEFSLQRRDKLRPRGGVTFFPLTRMFVAGVVVMFNDELSVNVYRDDRDAPIWSAKHGHWIVVPIY